MLQLGYKDFETKANWTKRNSFKFRISEWYRDKLSKYQNKEFFNKRMYELKDKLKMQDEILSEIKNKSF